MDFFMVFTEGVQDFRLVAGGQQPSRITYQISKSLGFNKDFKISKEISRILIKISSKISLLNLS